jgi:hypothetical protein
MKLSVVAVLVVLALGSWFFFVRAPGVVDTLRQRQSQVIVAPANLMLDHQLEVRPERAACSLSIEGEPDALSARRHSIGRLDGR